MKKCHVITNKNKTGVSGLITEKKFKVKRIIQDKLATT